MDDAYKRGRSGYSVKDEKDAAAYKEVGRKQATEIMGRAGSAVRNKGDVDSSVGNSGANWKDNTHTAEGRSVNAANMADAKDQLSKAEQSRRKSGDPKGHNAGDL